PPGQRVRDDALVADLADDLVAVRPDLNRPRRLRMPDRVPRDLAHRDHEVDDAVVRQACHPGLLLRQGAYLRQIRGVDERHAVVSRRATLVTPRCPRWRT